MLNLEDYKYVAIREFYTLIEKFIEVIVEFNSKIVWDKEWKHILEDKISRDSNPFEKFTFGDLINSLRVLRKNGNNFCSTISDETFSLLEKHVELRNKLTHEFYGNASEVHKINIVKDTSEIMYSLLDTFPVIIHVLSTDKEPWFDVEILWG